MLTDRPQRGITLIELVVFIVIVSVALAGVLSALNVATKGSADPLAPKQALAIAEGLLEEILLKSYCDPDTIDISTSPPTCGSNGSEARTAYDTLADYAPIDGAATVITTDALGNNWPANYTPDVTIATMTLAGVTGRQITVNVTYPGGTLRLTGCRMNY